MKVRPLPSIEVLKKHFNYNPMTGIFTHRMNRQGCCKGNLAGSREKSGRLRLSVEGKSYEANRIAYFISHGWCPDIVDHKDRDVTNDTILNLRPATHQQNIWNSVGHSDKTSSLPKGIRLSRNGKRFRANIQINGRRFGIGSFSSLEEAIAARNAIASKYHGEFFAEVSI